MTRAEYRGSWTSTAWCASPHRPHSLLEKWSSLDMWLGTGNADPCGGNQQHCATGKTPKPSVNFGPLSEIAIIIRDMYECMRISLDLPTKYYRWARSMLAREARKN